MPSQDIVLGLYYLSYEVFEGDGESVSFAMSLEGRERSRPGHCHRIPLQIHRELDRHCSGTIMYAARRIKGRFQTVDEEGNRSPNVCDTTPGRMLLGRLLPRIPNVRFDIVNRLLTKKRQSALSSI